jgi:hypothetical protein
MRAASRSETPGGVAVHRAAVLGIIPPLHERNAGTDNEIVNPREEISEP